MRYNLKRYSVLYARGLQRWLALVVVMLVLGACAHAGSTPIETASQTRPDSTITIILNDTTHLIPGQADYSRYDTPAACERTVYHIRARVWRQGELDTGRYSPQFDTMPTAAVIAGQQCAEKFTAQNVAPPQLFYFIRLSLAIGNDEQANAAILRQLTLAPDTAAQGIVLLQAIQIYLDAKPMRLAAAETLLPHLDALGNAARIGRLQAHHALLSYYAIPFEIDNMEREARAMIEISQTLTKEELDQWASLLTAPYLHLSSVVSFQQTPAAALDVLRLGATALSRVRGGQLRKNLLFMSQMATAQEKIYGQEAPQIVGHYFYNTGDTTTRPTPGKVSLMMTVNHNCGEFCYQQYAIVQRLYQDYASAGLEITLVARTMGFSPNSGVQTPAEEMEVIRKYFMEDRNLPVTLVVQETPFTTQPDGRRVNGQIQFEELYPSVGAVLVDRAGIVRWIGMIDISWESMLRAYVEKLLAIQ